MAQKENIPNPKHFEVLNSLGKVREETPDLEQKKIWEYDSLATGKLLEDNGIDSEDVSHLMKEKFKGSQFWNWDQRDYLNLAILGRATIVDILKLRESFSIKATAETKNPQQQLKQTRKSVGFAKPRKFGTVAEDSCYDFGDCLPHEIGGSSLDEAAREFKMLDVTKADDAAEMEEAFIKRAGKFIIACLNRRCNGTIYFGVADKVAGKERHNHGEVLGLPLPPNLRDTFETLMEVHLVGKRPKYFKGVDSEVKTAVQACVSPLQFVPVKGGADNAVVMELDVEPSASACQNLRFYIAKEKDVSQRRKSADKIPREKSRIYYLRENSSSNKYEDKEELDELSRKVKTYIRKREEQEKARKLENKSVKGNLERLLCRSRSSNIINDEEFRFVLVSSVANPDREQFSWVSSINWLMILEFNATADKNGIHKHFKDSSERLTEPTMLTAEWLTEESEQNSSTDEFLLKTSIGDRTLIVNSSGNTDDWFEKEFQGISELILQAYGRERFDRKQNIIVVILLDEHSNLEQVAKVLDSLRKRISSDQVVCLAEKDLILDSFQKKIDSSRVLGPESCKQMQRVDWNQLKEFILDKTTKVTYSGKTIPSSAGIELPVNAKIFDLHGKEDVHLLAANECEEYITMTAEEKTSYCENGNDMIKDFLKGGVPHWQVFYLSNTERVPVMGKILPGLVDREITDRIKDDLKQKEMERGKCVSRKRIVHQPGSGATTIGRHVLWKLRKQMRCIVLDGDDFKNGLELNEEKIKVTASRILNIRAFGESTETVVEETDGKRCATILILMDNSSDLLAKLLTAKIEQQVELRKIKFKRTMILLIYLISSFNLDHILAESDDLLSSQSDRPLGSPDSLPNLQFDTSKIEQKLSPSEKILFETRLCVLENEFNEDVILEDMLSFVIIAQSFNENSEYVKRVVLNSLRDMEKLFPNERKLLLYLSILKYYSNAFLPSNTCYQIAFSSIFRSTRGWTSLSPQSKTFLREKQIDSRKVVAKCTVLEVIHIPVAFQLMNTILNGFKVEDTVIKMLDSSVIMNEKFMKDYIHYTMRNLLVKRTREYKDGDHGRNDREPFSKLVTHINSTNGRSAARNLLEKGFQTLDNDTNRAFVAQALARLHYVKCNPDTINFREAKKWAFCAKEIRDTSFPIYDTLGQVFRRELRFLIEAHKSSNTDIHFKECEYILNAGKMAAHFFKTAQQYYLSGKQNAKFNHYHDELDLDSASDPTNNPGLLGEIVTNLEVIKHILATQDMENLEARKSFLQVLRKESAEDIRLLFHEIPWEWATFIEFITGLYARTDDCLRMITKKLGYVNMVDRGRDEKDWIWHLDSNVRDFGNIFGKPMDQWQKEISVPKLSNDTKLSRLRRYLTMHIANSFGWLLREACDVYQLNQMQAILKEMKRLSDTKRSNEVGLCVEDKLSFINVAFALAFKRADRHCLSVDTVAKYCHELVSNEVDDPEPYFFFLILFWPTTTSLEQADHLDTLKKCIRKLTDLEETFTDAKFGGGFKFRNRSFPLFFLSRRGYLRVAPADGGIRRTQTQEQDLKITGILDANKDVEIILAEDKRLKVRAANYHHRGSRAVKVTCTIGFTFSGPKAYYIESADTVDEMKKLMRLGVEPQRSALRVFK